MNREIKKYIYIVGGICIIFFLISVFLRILPWLLLVGVIGYAITRIVRFIKAKSRERHSSKFDNSRDDSYEYNISSDDYTTGEVIDVEYEDLENKK